MPSSLSCGDPYGRNYSLSRTSVEDLMESRDAEISRLLFAWSEEGDLGARDRLIPLVFDELRAIARRELRRERANHTLQPTAIVNELYLRLADQRKVQWRHRREFYGVASTLIRRILVDHARKRQAARRGQAVPMVSFEEALGVPIPEDSSIVDLDEALEALGRVDPRGAKVVELHAFGGLSFDEIAEALKIGRATALRDWNHAKLWLRRHLTRS